MVVIGGVLFFIFTGGKQAAEEAGGAVGLKEIVGSADSYSALLWASALGLATAVILGVGQRLVSLGQAVEAAVLGIKSMLLAAIILTLAWAIGSITGELHTADFLVHLLGDSLAPHWLPALVFIFAGLTSFATGSSWGTMGILVPLVIPLAHTLAPGSEIILMGAISSVLAGAVWGDHCSPISDTTVLSSMASSSDHVDHVNTQLPYAMLVGGVGLVVGDVATAFGVPYWVSWGVGLAILFGVLRLRGKKGGRLRARPNRPRRKTTGEKKAGRTWGATRFKKAALGPARVYGFPLPLVREPSDPLSRPGVSPLVETVPLLAWVGS